MNLPTLNDAGSLKGKRVILRADLNVLVSTEGSVINDFRIRGIFPTLEFLRDQQAVTLLMSHIEGTDSLRPVFNYLNKIFDFSFAETIEEGKTLLKKSSPGSFILLENTRRFSGEKKNDPAFARSLAACGDLFVNDAFASSHRAHASIVGVPELLPSYAGLLFEREVGHLTEALHPKRPALFILGGLKFETKRPLIEKFMRRYDAVFVGGAIANDFFKARGFEVGVSSVGKEKVDAALIEDGRIYLPKDVLVRSSGGVIAVAPDKVPAGGRIVDSGQKTLGLLRELVGTSSFVLWNGPLGYCEGGFTEATHALAKIIAESSATSIVGGGDTLGAITDLHLEDKFGFISTGGGAMLQFLADETLPGIKALLNSKRTT